MKKFKFKDGSVITASTVEEAKAKYKIVAKPKPRRASVPVNLIKKLMILGFDDGNNDVELDREDNNFKYVQFSNSGNTKYIILEYRYTPNRFVLTIQDEHNSEATLKSFNTIDRAVAFLEKPGVMSILKEFV